MEKKDEKDRQEEARRRFSRAITSLTWCGSCWPMLARDGVGQALPDPAFGRQRQVQLHRLAGAPAHRPAKDGKPIFDSIIVVTDRRMLDQQIRDTIKQFAQVGATVGHAEHSGDLRKFIESGKKIIISTVQKFPFILDEIGDEHRRRKFAIIIDEAHSSQGGKTSAAMNAALGRAGEDEDERREDKIKRIMESRKMLTNASYFAFTATPKNKTLEIFGEPYAAAGRQGEAPARSTATR